MEVNIKDKFFWFVFFELFCGFFASVAFLGSFGSGITPHDASGHSSHDTNNLLINTLLPGAFVPLVFRSQLYTYDKSLSKTQTLVLMIVTLVFYIAGGIILFLDDYNSGAHLVRGILAIAAGGIMIADLIFLVK